MRRLSPRAAKRMMKRMGLTFDRLEGVKEVVFKMEDKELVVENPEVSVLKVQGQEIFQVAGEVSERSLGEPEEAKSFPEEDIQLVAQQSGVSFEEAKAALMECDGDLAKAILLLTQKHT
ncbi:MAG TPA: nascent polypeptide-associated complex protein [Candidatus Bathyarchaeota archaeon]|nr:MAG: nascent polypeptide-associated complex protein [Candidatus Bathyarchaeota archaeon B24-2]HDN62675.1 nascent polypeptide-associated complex protein [Candidatus Bathyarchaeota archaeon]